MSYCPIIITLSAEQTPRNACSKPPNNWSSWELLFYFCSSVGIHSRQVHNWCPARCNWSMAQTAWFGPRHFLCALITARLLIQPPKDLCSKSWKTSVFVHMFSDESHITSAREVSMSVWMVHLQVYHLSLLEYYKGLCLGHSCLFLY